VESVRIDRWLWAARVFKTRSLCGAACSGGHVRLNGSTAKPSARVHVGDEVRAERPGGLRILEVAALAERRLSAPLARDLYLDRSPPPPPREPRAAVRARGAGRPTKRDRRALQRLYRRDPE
jgi:ribosome-associated heat shock protein Hsp15